MLFGQLEQFGCVHRRFGAEFAFVARLKLESTANCRLIPLKFPRNPPLSVEANLFAVVDTVERRLLRPSSSNVYWVTCIYCIPHKMWFLKLHDIEKM